MHGPAGFAQRLGRHGLDQDLLLGLLAEPVAELAARRTEPGWARFVSEVIAHAPQVPVRAPPCTGLETLAPALLPFVTLTTARLRVWIGDAGMAARGSSSPKRRATGDGTFLRHATDIGDRLIGSAKDSGRELYWTTDGERQRSVGYAHGSAGVALFLLYLHCATEDARFLTFGGRALRHDLNQELPRARGGIGYPAFVDNPQLEPYWERGSAGVGVALARYCRFTGDTRLRTTLDRMVTSNLIGTAINAGLFGGMSGLVNLASDCRTLYSAESDRDL